MSSPPMATLPAQPSGPPPLGDVNESVAVTLLAEMLRSKKINDRENEEHKQNYLVMHERVVETRAKEQALAKLVHTYCASRSTAPHTPAPVYTAHSPRLGPLLIFYSRRVSYAIHRPGASRTMSWARKSNSRGRWKSLRRRRWSLRG